MALSSCVGSINFAHHANIRKTHEELMSQVRTEAIHICNKHKIQTEPIQFECNKFLPTLGKDFLKILNEVLSHNSQQHQIPNSNRSTLNENRNQYNAGIYNRTRALKTPSPSTTHPNRANRFQHVT